MEPIIEAWILPYERSLREQRWRSGALYEEWKARFGDELPLFFDAAADWFVKHQGTTEGYGFYETLAGILLYQATGYLPMTSAYDFKFLPTKDQLAKGNRDPVAEKEKRRVVETLFSEEELRVIRDTSRSRTQPPDLLMFTPDLSDWFFCEVKGGIEKKRDELNRGQVEKFTEIAQVTGKPVRTLRFEPMARCR